MVNRSAIRLYAAAVTTSVLLTAAPALAQYRPQTISNPATGESYHIEFAAGFWNPTADVGIASESLGIPGTDINFKSDLGLTDQRVPQFRLVLRASKRNKFRFEFIPMNYTQSAKLTRSIVFNGQRYDVGIPVSSTFDWKAWRFGYEFDLISRDRGYLGLVLDAKYTDVQATLTSPLTSEYAHAKAPIPAIGGILRVYPMSNVSVTAEITGASLTWVPSSIRKDNAGHYADIDLYGTVNFTDYIGAQVGWRSLDLGYTVPPDNGTLKMKGLYFGAVVRY